MTEDESGDDEDDELLCVIGGESEGYYVTRLAKFNGEFIPDIELSSTVRRWFKMTSCASSHNG